MPFRVRTTTGRAGRRPVSGVSGSERDRHCSSVAGRAGRPRPAAERFGRFGSSRVSRHGEVQGPPVPDDGCPEQAAHPVPEMEDALPVIARLPEQRPAVPLHPVGREGGHGERREDVRRVVPSVPEVVPEPASVPRLECPERLVLADPSAAGGPHDGHHRVPVEREVGDPREHLHISLRVDLPVV